MNYIVSDLLFKIAYKIKDYLLKIFWIIQLGRLGKNSFIRSKTQIIGNPKRIQIGDNFKIYENCTIALGRGKINIGNDGLLGVGTYINVGDEVLEIGNGVAVAPFCRFFTYSHHYNLVNPVINTYKTGNIIVEDDVLIGANCVILPGVIIGKGSIIAAGSIVNSNVPSNCVYGGVPAVFIKYRVNEGADNLQR